MKKMRYVGIDVGAKELVVVIRRNGKPGDAKTFDNTFEGRQKLVNYLNPKKHTARICLEATGMYHLDIAIKLACTENVEIMVANPQQIKSFANALKMKNKTDPQDAAMIAEYVERMAFIPWEKPPEKHLKLRTFSRRISGLVEIKAQLKCQVHAYGSTEETPPAIIEETQELIKQLEAHIESMFNHAMALVHSDAELLKTFELACSVKGIAEMSAIQILGELLVLPEGLKNKQWVAFAGLNPRIFQSGTSVNKKPCLSKAGNRYLRKALYMPALTAATRDAHVRGYYLHLIDDNGLKKKQALAAVMRKLLHALHGMLSTESEFDNTRFYAKAYDMQRKARNDEAKLVEELAEAEMLLAS